METESHNLQRTEKDLRKSQADYHAIFDAASDAIFIHHMETGDIIDVNRKMCQMYGYEPEELKGLDVWDISSGEPPYSQKDAMRWIKKAIDEGPQVFEWLAKNKNGRLFWVEVNLKCAFIGGENRILAIVRDISRRKKVLQELRHAKQTAELRAIELATINRFAMAIGSTLDLQRILQTICKEMVQIFKARNAGIGLVNHERTSLTLAAFHTTRKQENASVGLKIPLANNASTHYVLETGQPIVVPDAQNNPLTASMHEVFRSRGTHCIMIVPLLSRGEVIGTIGLPASEKGRIYTDEEVSLAQTIAGQIASAIENARLYAETEKAKDLAEHELEIGRQIQSGFFPDRLPTFPDWEIEAHFQAANQVAGDFYDVFMLGKQMDLGLVIADVCDKGVGAALFMALFRSLLRAYAFEMFAVPSAAAKSSLLMTDEALRKTLESTNNYIAKTHYSTNMFATIFFGILDLKTGLLTYINGGHEAPVIIGADGIKACLQTTGPAVGMFPDLHFDTRRIELIPGDTLLTFTDGVTDSQNLSGEFFTKNRLLELVSRPFPSASTLLGRIRKEISQHASGSKRYDDVTIMAVRRK